MVIKRLEEFLDPVYPGILSSEEEAKKGAEKIKSSNVNGLLVSPLIWCEDRILRAALKTFPKLPIILWTFAPSSNLPDFLCFKDMLKYSGGVGSLQFSGLLKREGWSYQSVAGSYQDGEVIQDIKKISLAFYISERLRRVRIGIIPFRCELMSTTYVDEFKLRTLYGVELKYLELNRFKETARAISEKKIDQFREQIIKDGQIIQVDARNLKEGIRYTLAMEEIILKENLNILAINDVCSEMHKSLGLRPCLSNPVLSNSGVVVAMEADVAAGIAMYILRLFIGESPFYTEPFSSDFENNSLLLGHAGYHDSINSDKSCPVKIIPDLEYENSDPFSGAVTYFKYKPGAVTLINSVFNGERLKMTAVEGESLPGSPKVEGNCHLFCRLNPSLTDFYNRCVESGVSQHWIVVTGHILKDLKLLCRLLNIEFSTIE